MTGLELGPPALPGGWPIRVAGYVHLMSFGLIVPALVIRSRGAMQRLRAYPPLVPHHLGTALMLAILGFFSLLVAILQRVRLRAPHAPPATSLLVAATLLAAMIAVSLPQWRKAVVERRVGIYFRMLRTRGEYAVWSLVSLLAGVFEEISWRGVQTTLLASLLGNAWLAAVLCAVMFALAHANQRRATVAIVFGFALGSSLLVALTGSLWLAMAVHAIFDLTAGFVVAHFCRTLGYVPPPLPAK